jgi:TM2 domain-containing membrane protein YozV
MARIIDVLPELTGEEMLFVQQIISGYTDEKARSFATIYRNRRRDPMLILVLTLVGFVGFAGIHRMLIDQIGMGILYFFTAGLCFIGTIVDLVNYQKLAFEYNSKIAREAAVLVEQ